MSINFQLHKTIPRPYLLSILCGLLVGTSYIPFPGWALLFCYIPLWLCVLELHEKNENFKKIFYFGWIAQFILTLIGFNWIYHVSSEFGHLPWFISTLALIAFAACMHIYIPISACLGLLIIRKNKIAHPLLQILILSLTLALLERIWPSIFEWNLAYSLLWIKAPLFQWADMVGFWGLSTWLLVAQAFLAYAFLQFKKNKKQGLQSAGYVILVLAFLSGVGLLKEKHWSFTDSSVQVAVIQANVGNAEKIQAEKQDQFQSYILGLFIDLSSSFIKTNQTPDLMIWPETALPFALDVEYHNRFLQQGLLQKVKQWNLTLLTGGYSQSQTKKDHLGSPLTRNSIFLLNPNLGFAAEPYHKTELLAFGEYLPLGEQFPSLYNLFPFVGVYERGPGPTTKIVELQNGKKIRLGPQICYESLDPAFSRGLAQSGSQVLFNVTNDSWFGWWAEPYQHNIMTLARAIENRRPLIRSTNTGVSSAILANGEILEQSKPDTAWAYSYAIPYWSKAPLTFYTQYGYYDWIIWLLLLIGLAYKGKYVRH